MKLWKLTLPVFQLLCMPTFLVLDPANETTKSYKSFYKPCLLVILGILGFCKRYTLQNIYCFILYSHDLRALNKHKIHSQTVSFLSLSNLFILTDKFSHSIKKHRTHHGDNLVWAPQTHMVNKLNSIQSQFGIWLLSKQTVKYYLFKRRIM